MGNRRLLLLGAVASVLALLYYWDIQTRDDEIIRAVHSDRPSPETISITEDSAPTTKTLPGLAVDDALLPPLTGNPLAGLKLSDLQATRNRPLFTPSRRAPRPATNANANNSASSSTQPADPETKQAPDPEETAKAGQFVLMGVVKGDSERLALLRHKATGELLRLREGDIFDGWSLDSLESDRVHLSKGGLQEVIVLFQEDESG